MSCGRKSINEVNYATKDFVPKMQGDGGMVHSGKREFDNVSMLSFCNTILLRSVGTRCLM